MMKRFFLAMLFLTANFFAQKIYAQEIQEAEAEKDIAQNAEEIEEVEIEKKSFQNIEEILYFVSNTETDSLGEKNSESQKNSKLKISAQKKSSEATADDLQKNYHIEKDSRQRIKFVQNLSWQAIPNVEHYEVEIQKFIGQINSVSTNSNEAWTTVLKETVSQNFIEVSLESGNYRFRVQAANLLERERKSEWERFTILKASIPKINSVLPKKIFVDTEKNQDGIFSLHGENFLPLTLFSLLAVDGEGAEQEIAQGKILEVSADGKMARVQFDLEKFQEGGYKISANNPGDFSATSETFYAKIKFLAFETVQLNAAYFLPILFYDGTSKEYMYSKITFLNAGADISLIFLVKNKMHFGVGVKANYTRLPMNTEYYDLTGNYLTGMLNLLYQGHIIPQKLILELHGLAGVATLFDTKFDYTTAPFTSPSMDAMGLAFGGGFMLQYHPGKAKHFFVAAGADFIHVKFKDMSCGTLSPQISFGVKF